MNKNSIYLDYNASTPTFVEVKNRLVKALDEEGSFGNPSSIHWAGRLPKLWIREARLKLSEFLGCSPLELIFTSGGSESNNTVIRGLEHIFNSTERREFITTRVEHPSVIKTFEEIEKRGALVHFIPVSRSGELDLEFLASKLSERTALVSVMAANNETGAMHPLAQIVKMAHAQGALVHSDMVQMLGKVPFHLHELDLDYASFSGHKFYSIKGTGLLYQKKNSPTVTLLSGGAQERSRRGGTENTFGILALGVMAGKMAEVSDQQQRLERLRNQMEAQILKQIPQVTVTCSRLPRLPNTSSLVLQGVDGETLLMSLDLKGFAVSTGAACSSGNPEPSPVLLAMGLTRAEAQNSLRVSLGWMTTEMEVNLFVQTLVEVVERLRRINSEEGA